MEPTTFFDDVEGYAGRLSYLPGDTVTLHLSSRRPQVDVVVERWGAERLEVARWDGIDVGHHDPPADADAHGCGWPAALEFEVAPDWRSGFYLVTLTAVGADLERSSAHACFVVRGSGSGALLVLATNTWHAYNAWGGRSLYTGGAVVSHARPFGRGMLDREPTDRDDRKARPMRWGERADVDGLIFQDFRNERSLPAAIGSSGWFAFERRFVEWSEAAGFEFDYAVSSDLEGGDALDGYSLVLSVGHDEYWSAPQRDTLESFIASGGNFASFSGNTMFWRVRLEEGPRGPTMVCHKYTAHDTDPIVATDPAAMTGMWCDPQVGRPEWTVLGAGSAFGLYYRFGAAVAHGSGGFTVYDDAHWLFEGTGLRYGDVIGMRDGVVGYETLGCPIQFDDRHVPVPRRTPLGTADLLPDDMEIVAFAPSSNLAMGEYPKSISALSDQGDLEFVAQRLYGSTDPETLERVRRGTAVVVVARPFGSNGGEVVTVGTTDWAFGLAADTHVQRVTTNVLDRLT